MGQSYLDYHTKITKLYTGIGDGTISVPAAKEMNKVSGQITALIRAGQYKMRLEKQDGKNAMGKTPAYGPDDPYVELIVLVCDLALDIGLLTELPMEKRDALFSFAMQIQRKAVALNKARLAPKNRAKVVQVRIMKEERPPKVVRVRITRA